MEHLIPLLALNTTFLVGVVGLFGWSHRKLSQKIDELEKHVFSNVTETKVRLLIQDHLRPMQVEQNSLSARLDEIKLSVNATHQRLDRLIEALNAKKFQ